MATRIDVYPNPDHWPTTLPYRATSYCIASDLDRGAAEQAAELLSNPLTEIAQVNQPPPSVLAALEFSHAVDVHFRPGVTDNCAKTALEILAAADLIQNTTPVFTGTIHFTDKPENTVRLFNNLIETATVVSKEEFLGTPPTAFTNTVQINGNATALEVDLHLTDTELKTLSDQGIVDNNGIPRGPLGLALGDMKAIASHYETLGRPITDIELETYSQSWSEHCKHRIFAARLDEIEQGLFKHYIARATFEINSRPDKQGFCLSVFDDNAGAIAFDDKWMICDKVETHNSPSALDPFGGAMTGIVGVNRDCLGFGLGARPIANRYGFCFAEPDNSQKLYRDRACTISLLSGKQIAQGVINGIEAGGNHSGIPTPQGFAIHDPRYRGKPLVFCGTVGLLPRTLPGTDQSSRPAEKKCAQAGDCIIIVGGRTGLDGIHGATFSSVEMDEDSPATAVQIGDPITQKRLSDVFINEVLYLGQHNAVTDNGAGGLSSSIGEMAQDCGGAQVDLAKVAQKYPGLEPWQIWISESQERMTFAVPPRHCEDFIAAFRNRGVEATNIGNFTDTNRLVLTYDDKTLGDIDLEFLHKGASQLVLASKTPTQQEYQPVDLSINELIHASLDTPSLRSRSDLAERFDHEVQSSSIIKPLQGPGRIAGDASVIAPIFSSDRAVALSQALFPWLTETAPYLAATTAIDNAIRNLIAVGANPEKIALLDNFCWCSALDPERLYQLKHAARGCYDAAIHFSSPFVSGKDSMFNDLNAFDKHGRQIKISALPTLLISSIGIVDDISHCQTMDFKVPGDTIILVGNPGSSLGGSCLAGHLGKHWQPPCGFTLTQTGMLASLHRELISGNVASAVAIGPGGLFNALVRAGRAGQLGAKVDLATHFDNNHQLFSETGGQFLLTCQPGVSRQLCKNLPGAMVIGMVKDEQTLDLTLSDHPTIEVAL